jgi:hypothetical protein
MQDTWGKNNKNIENANESEVFLEVTNMINKSNVFYTFKQKVIVDTKNPASKWKAKCH